MYQYKGRPFENSLIHTTNYYITCLFHHTEAYYNITLARQNLNYGRQTDRITAQTHIHLLNRPSTRSCYSVGRVLDLIQAINRKNGIQPVGTEKKNRGCSRSQAITILADINDKELSDKTGLRSFRTCCL